MIGRAEAGKNAIYITITFICKRKKLQSAKSPRYEFSMQCYAGLVSRLCKVAQNMTTGDKAKYSYFRSLIYYLPTQQDCVLPVASACIKKVCCQVKIINVYSRAITFQQEIIKVRESIPHIGPLTKVIHLKLFLDIVPSSYEDITCAMLGQPKRLSRIT